MSSASDDYPFHIPTRAPPAPPPPAPPPPPAQSVPGVPAIHIHLAPAESGPAVTPRPWYFTGPGFLWMLAALVTAGGGVLLAWQWLQDKGWL